jgi:hypothetical protein
MDADFSIELNREDPVLDFPWKDPAGKFAYVDLKGHPELLARLPEAEAFPELAEFLRTVNSPPSMFETAKCDAWATTELSAEEEIYDASHKSASYVDVVASNMSTLLSNSNARLSLSANEQFARKLVQLLQHASEIPAAAEVCVRRCYFVEKDGIQKGFYSTLYVSGYGNDEATSRLNWGAGLKLAQHAILQLSVSGVG